MICTVMGLYLPTYPMSNSQSKFFRVLNLIVIHMFLIVIAVINVSYK